jgi:AcrR family transcriptional regulator
MTPRPHKKRVSKADWLAAALEELERGGVDAVRIEQLARKLGVAKSGFYWHFQDRPDLLREMMRFWEHEYTGVVADNPEVTALEPKRRLLTTAEMILDHELTRYDLAMRAWAAHDKSAAGAVAEVYRKRMNYTRRAFRELGFTGAELDMRTRLYVCYHSWERTTFGSQDKASSRRSIKRRIELLTRK